MGSVGQRCCPVLVKGVLYREQQQHTSAAQQAGRSVQVRMCLFSSTHCCRHATGHVSAELEAGKTSTDCELPYRCESGQDIPENWAPLQKAYIDKG